MSDKPSVLFLTQYYVPEIGAPQARIHELAQRLLRRGYQITVLTAMPNYPNGVIQKEYRGRWFVKETIDDVSIVRSPIYPTKSSGLVKRLSNYFSFVVTSILVGLFRVRRHELLIIESPPLFLGLSAWLICLVKRTKLVMNVSDLWPESIVRLGALNNRFALSLAERLERFLYRTATTVTGQSVGICRGVRSVDSEVPVALIPNGCDCEKFGQSQQDLTERRRLGWDHHFVVGYAGLIGLAQGIDLIVNVAELLRGDERFRFLIAGDGPELDMITGRVSELELDNIEFLGFRNKTEMPGLVASFDASIIPLKHYIPGALPSKIYETMASEVPVVLAALGDPKELVERARAGIVVDYDSPAETADALIKLANDEALARSLGNNGRDYVERFHDRDAIAESMDRVLVATVNGDQAFFETDLAATVWKPESKLP